VIFVLSNKILGAKEVVGIVGPTSKLDARIQRALTGCHSAGHQRAGRVVILKVLVKGWRCWEELEALAKLGWLLL